MPDSQKGLVGELVLLRKLLLLARETNIPAATAFERWNGYDKAKRDFSGPAMAIEVKATSNGSRIHRIGSLAQLEPQDDEEVFLFSVGVRIDASAPKKLPDYVSDVNELLVTSNGEPDSNLRDRFAEALRRYGYEVGRESLYRSCPGFMNFHLPPKLFRERDLKRIRLDSFKGDQLPSMVIEVGYTLEVLAPELSPSAERQVLLALIGTGMAPDS